MSKNSKSLTRLVIVQALYQMEMAGTDVSDIVSSVGVSLLFEKIRVESHNLRQYERDYQTRWTSV